MQITDEYVRTRYGISEDEIPQIVAHRVDTPLQVDGCLDEAAWQSAHWSPRFVDLVTGEPGLYESKVACLWNDERLYVGYHVEEPYLKASLTERDSLVWYDDDLELFIAGPDAYWELEVNEFGTLYEVLHVWADATVDGAPWHTPAYDPRRRDARGFTGNGDPDKWDWDGLHPRGHRWSFLDWDMPGLEVAVALDGSVNDNSDVDRGWSVEMAVPWSGISTLLFGPSRDAAWVPTPGFELRCCFARFKSLALNGRFIRPQTGWALNRHGRYDIHVPEAFPVVRLDAAGQCDHQSGLPLDLLDSHGRSSTTLPSD